MWQLQEGIIGTSSFFAADDTQRVPLGFKQQGFDNFWGGGEFIYMKASGTIAMGVLCTWDQNFLATAVTNTAGLGRSLAVAAVSLTINQFGWFQVYGNAPISATASVAAGTTVGITAAGQVGAMTAGKQVLGAVSVAASATTVVKANVGTVNGSAAIYAPNIDGWFVGATMSGTGISGTIVSFNPDGHTVVLSANASATGSISATATYTNFNLVQVNNPIAQGQIL